MRVGLIGVGFAFAPESSTAMTYALRFTLAAKNRGRVSIKAPYMRISYGHLEPASSDILRKPFEGGYGLYTSTSTVLHVEDSLPMGTFKTGIKFFVPNAQSSADAMRLLKASYNEDQFSIRPWSQLLGSDRPFGDDRIKIEGLVGSEEISPQTFAIDLTKRQTFEAVMKRLFVREG